MVTPGVVAGRMQLGRENRLREVECERAAQLRWAQEKWEEFQRTEDERRERFREQFRADLRRRLLWKIARRLSEVA